MPDKLLLASALEAALLLSGLFFLWRCALSPTARAAAAGPQPLPHWDIPGYVYGLSVLRVVCVSLGVQLVASALLRHFNPSLSMTEGLGLTVNSLIFQLSVLAGLLVGWLLLKPARFVADLNASTAVQPILPPLLPWSKVPAASFATFTIILTSITPVALLWQWLLGKLGRPATDQQAAALFKQADSVGHIALLLLLATVIAPLTEELVFRSGLFRYVRGRLPRVIAFLAPALLFAALHDNLIVVILPLIIFGVIQAIAYERTGRLTVPIIAHALFNLHTAAMILADADPYHFLQSPPVP